MAKVKKLKIVAPIELEAPIEASSDSALVTKAFVDEQIEAYAEEAKGLYVSSTGNSEDPIKGNLHVEGSVYANGLIGKYGLYVLDESAETITDYTKWNSVALEKDLTLSGTVTKDIGGILKDTTYENASIKDILTELLFPYVEPSFADYSAFTTYANSGTFEYGTTKTVSKVKVKFNLGSKPITSIKIGTTEGGDDLYSGEAVTSDEYITLTTQKEYDGTTGGTIYCTLSDGTTEIKKSVTFSYSYYTYYAVTDNTSEPTSWTATGSSSTSDITINSNAGQYIWIAASSSGYSGICALNELSNKYNPASPTTKVTGKTLTNSLGYTCTASYTFYRLTDALQGSGQATYKLG